MGFLTIIPANKLAAFYDSAKHELILSASGEVQEFAYGFHFTRDNSFFGGLKFTLMAWVGPLGHNKQAFEFQQSFPIALPSPVYPSGNVIIVTSNHPDGLTVPIHYAGLQPHELADQQLKAASDKEVASQAKGTSVPGILPGHTRLNVLYKTQFTVKASAIVPKMGSVNIKFDKTYVELVNTGIEDTDIVWTFQANKMGHTPIVVTTSGGIAQFIMEHTYDVFIFVL